MNWIKTIFICGMTTAVMAGTGFSAELKVGVSAPVFEAKDQDGKLWKLENHVGEKYLVLYFYPAAMTGGCTKQACSYRDYKKEFSGNAKIEVVGISADPVENLKYFQQAEQLNFTLLSDADGSIAKAYGVPIRAGEKSIVRTVGEEEVTLSRNLTTSRCTFVVDTSGKIIYRDLKVKATADLQNILDFIQND